MTARSRYPVKSYATCTNDRPWAWCFDRPCVVYKDDPSKAVCACKIVKDEGPYVMVTESYSDTTCITGENLKPFELKVVNQ